MKSKKNPERPETPVPDKPEADIRSFSMSSTAIPSCARDALRHAQPRRSPRYALLVPASSTPPGWGIDRPDLQRRAVGIRKQVRINTKATGYAKAHSRGPGVPIHSSLSFLHGSRGETSVRLQLSANLLVCSRLVVICTRIRLDAPARMSW